MKQQTMNPPPAYPLDSVFVDAEAAVAALDAHARMLDDAEANDNATQELIEQISRGDTQETTLRALCVHRQTTHRLIRTLRTQVQKTQQHVREMRAFVTHYTFAHCTHEGMFEELIKHTPTAAVDR
jgi:hypothetical protein